MLYKISPILAIADVLVESIILLFSIFDFLNLSEWY